MNVNTTTFIINLLHSESCLSSEKIYGICQSLILLYALLRYALDSSWYNEKAIN